MSKTCNPNSDKRNDPLFVCNPKSGRYVKRKACKQPPPAGVSPRTHDCDPITGKWVLKAVPPPNIPTSAADKVLSNPDILSSYFHSGHLSKAQRNALAVAMGSMGGKTQTSAEYKKRCRDEIANELNLGRPIVKEDVVDDGLYLKYKDCIFKIAKNKFKQYFNTINSTDFSKMLLSFFYFYEGTESEIYPLDIIRSRYLKIFLKKVKEVYDHFLGTPQQPKLTYEDFIHIERIIMERLIIADNSRLFDQKNEKELFYILLCFLDFKKEKQKLKEKAIHIINMYSGIEIANKISENLLLHLLSYI